MEPAWPWPRPDREIDYGQFYRLRNYTSSRLQRIESAKHATLPLLYLRSSPQRDVDRRIYAVALWSHEHSAPGCSRPNLIHVRITVEG